MLKDFRQKPRLLIDMTVPIKIIVSVKPYQNLSKYKYLEIEISKMQNIKTRTISVVIEALRMITKELIPIQLRYQETRKWQIFRR